MKETANMGKGKTLLISAGIEIMLIICITAANLNPAPILYFIFYNLLYGLVFSLLIPLYCLYKETPYGYPFMLFGNNKENGAPASGRVLAEVGFKKPGLRQWVVLAAFVVFSVGGQLIPKMAVGEQIPVMRVSSTIAAAVTLVLIDLILLLYRNADRRIRRQ